MVEDLIRWLHVIGAAVLFGTGLGIAFFMLMAVRTGAPSVIAAVARIVVVADFVFTATAVVAQPVTGIILADLTGWSLRESWILLSLGLYVFAGALWLPVFWIQIELRDLAMDAAKAGAGLPSRFYSLYRIWFAMGVPAFLAVAAIFWLMLAKPNLRLP